MPVTSFPWAGISPGQAGPYTANQFAAFIAQLYDRPGISLDTGVAAYSNNGANLFPSNLLLGFGLDAYPNASPNMSVNIGNGAAIVNGIYVTVTGSAVNLVVSSNSSGNPRIDTAVIHLDYTLQTATIILLTGTPSGSPVPPNLTRTANVIWEIPLADIAVANGVSSITLANIQPRQIPQSAPDGVYMPVTNNSGVTLQTGDIVVWDTSATQAVKTSTTLNDNTVAGVVVGRTTAGAIGLILVQGIGWINVGGAVTRGQMIAQSTTAKQGISGANGANLNAFAYAIAPQASTGLIPAYINAIQGSGNAATWLQTQRPYTSFKAAPGFTFTSTTFVVVNSSTCRLTITPSHTNAIILVTFTCAVSYIATSGGNIFVDMLIDGATYASGGNSSGTGFSEINTSNTTTNLTGAMTGTFVITLATVAAHTIDLVIRETGSATHTVALASATALEVA